MASRRRRSLRLLLLLPLVALALAWVLASLDWCDLGPERPTQEVARARGQGALQVGAARVPLQPPVPAPGGAGYAPPLPQMEAGALPLMARALVLQVGEARVGLLSLELVSAPRSVVDGVRARVAGLGLDGVLVTATHTHSSLGGYDPRPVAQLAGMGRFRPELLEVVVAAGAQALTRAAAALEPARLELGEAAAPALVRSRSGEEAPDGRLLRAAFVGGRGTVGELLVFSAHPTLVPRHLRALDPDYPGRLAGVREAAGAGVSLVLQGAAGNASAVMAWEAPGGAPEAFARALALQVAEVPVAPVAVSTLGYARVQVALPEPDASRLVPGGLEDAGETLLCGSAGELAEVSALTLGPLRLVSMPGEPSVGAGRRIAEATGARAVLGLADGYLGYVETPEAVEGERGEARRQYFAPSLLARLTAAAQAATAGAGPAGP
jgi:neutral ceramidase